MDQQRCLSWVLVAHICNPSYSGGRDQEDHGSRFELRTRHYLEKTRHKNWLVEWLKVQALSSSPSNAKILYIYI
jgi:hypothetical protein